MWNGGRKGKKKQSEVGSCRILKKKKKKWGNKLTLLISGKMEEAAWK